MDSALAYQISYKSDHSQRSYDVLAIVIKASMVLQIYFQFPIWSCVAIKNVKLFAYQISYNTAQFTAEILLLPVYENEQPPILLLVFTLTLLSSSACDSALAKQISSISDHESVCTYQKISKLLFLSFTVNNMM